MAYSHLNGITFVYGNVTDVVVVLEQTHAFAFYTAVVVKQAAHDGVAFCP